MPCYANQTVENPLNPTVEIMSHQDCTLREILGSISLHTCLGLGGEYGEDRVDAL